MDSRDLVAVVSHEDQQLNRVSVVSNPFSIALMAFWLNFVGHYQAGRYGKAEKK